MKVLKWYVHTASGNDYEITEEQADRVKQVIMKVSKNTPLLIGDAVVMSSSIMEVFSRLENTRFIPKQPLLAAPTTELTDEQRVKNIDRIRDMKRRFMSRKTTV